MATSNSRDVELALRVSTLGEEGIRRLEEDIRKLAAQGGDAAPEFERLADAVSKIGAQARDLQALSNLSDEVQQLGAAQRVAADTADALGAELIELTGATDRFRASEGEAKTALQNAQRDLVAQKDALRLLRIETDEAGKNTDGFKQSVRDAKLSILEAEQAVRALKDSYQQAQNATRAAADQERDLERSYATSTRRVEEAGRALSERNRELREARDAMSEAGVATNDLTAAQSHLVGALNAAGNEAQAIQAAQERMAAAAREQAAEEERLAGVMLRTRNAMADAAKAEADGIIRDFERMQGAERAAAQEAQAAAATIANAFKTVGAKSVQDLEAEIGKVRTAMQTLQSTAGLSGAELERAMRLGNQRIRDLERDIRAANGQLTLTDRIAGGLKSTLGQFAAGFGIVEVVTRLASGFVGVNKEMEGLRLGLNVIYKDAGTTAKQIEFLRAVSNQAGVSFSAISESFLKFAAATQNANIPMSETNALFSAITRTAGALGLSGDRVSRMLEALAQMSSKGKVSLEELSQQLGDSLPGALSLTAKGLGITDRELLALVESGGLLARDLFPALTRSLQSMQTEVDTMSARWERFKNMLASVANDAADTGVWEVLKVVLSGLGVTLDVVARSLLFVGDAAVTNAKIFKAVATGELKQAGRLFDDFVDRQVKSGEKLVANAKLLTGVADSAKEATPAQLKFADATQKVGAAAQAATPQIGTQTQAMQTAAGAAGSAATSQGAFASATERAAAAATQTGRTIVQLATEYANSAKQLAVNTQVQEKLVKAREVEGQSLVDLSRLTGSQRQALDAETQAAQGNLLAQLALSNARTAEAAALRVFVAQLQEEIRLRGDPDGNRQKELDKRRDALALMEAEATRSADTVRALQGEVQARQLARQSFEDNSAALAGLREVMLNAQDTLRGYTALEKEGFATKQQVEAATRAAAAAEGLYRDALRDSGEAAERNIQQLQNRNIVIQAGLGLEAERARSLEALAKKLGDENLASQASISQKEIEIRSRRANAAAIAAEAAEMLRNAEAQRASQIASGDWTAQKEAEYQRTRAQAEAKRQESETIKESTRSLEREIEKLRENAGAHGDNGKARRDLTADIKEQAKALDELYNRNRVGGDPTKTADGFQKGADGAASGQFNNTLPIDQADRLRRTNGAGMTGEQIDLAVAQAKAAFQDMEAFLKLNPGAAGIDYQQGVREMMNAALVAEQKRKLQTGRDEGPRESSAPKTLRIDLGRGAREVNLASDRDVDTVVSLFRELESSVKSAA